MTRDQLDRLFSCVRHDGCSDYTQYTNGLKLHFADLQAVEDLFDKQEKYKWHDLRKDPNDLPNSEYVYTRHIGGYGIAHKILVIQNREKYIAWREIEPFED